MKPELQVGVKILLKNPEGKYLLMRRSPEKYPETQKWDIPGGRIHPGTPLLENLAREVAEETGLTISNSPRLIAAQDILKMPKLHVVRLTYVGEAEGNPQLSEEHTEYGWFTMDEIRTLEPLDSYVKTLLSEGIHL
ncbi:MAG TPA: NUDIX domain-containing protein [Candidatus Paceibacterota bacterium]|nr:NUDIX domain-containing protein [Candidatus Paceibacterota bacterium]